MHYVSCTTLHEAVVSRFPKIAECCLRFPLYLFDVFTMRLLDPANDKTLVLRRGLIAHICLAAYNSVRIFNAWFDTLFYFAAGL